MIARGGGVRPWRDPVVVLVVAGALVGAATQVRLSRYDGIALGLVVVGLVVLARSLGVAGDRPGAGVVRGVGLRRGLVVALVAVHVATTVPLARVVFDGASDPVVATAVVAAAVGLVAALDQVRAVPRLGRWGAAVLVVAVGVLGVCWLASQGTNIDVYLFQRVGAERVLAGESPWAPGYPNPYDAAESQAFYGPGLADGDVLRFGFPYPPLSLVLSTVGHLLGDVRVAHLLAVLAAGWLLLDRAGERWTGRAGGVLLLTSPMLLPMVQRGWTEAFLVLGLVAAVLVLRSARRDATAVVVLGCLLALKQYAVLLLPVLLVVGPRWQTARERWRAAWRATVVAAVVTLPLALWGLADFVFSVGLLQFRQPFRDDAMSLPAVAARVWDWPGETLALPGMVLAVGSATWWVLHRAPRTWSAAAAGTGVVMLAFLLFNKQAFTNYYMFAVATIWLAVAVHDGELEGQDDGHLPR